MVTIQDASPPAAAHLVLLWQGEKERRKELWQHIQ
jgi:hypothetical protein